MTQINTKKHKHQKPNERHETGRVLLRSV